VATDDIKWSAIQISNYFDALPSMRFGRLRRLREYSFLAIDQSEVFSTVDTSPGAVAALIPTAAECFAPQCVSVSMPS